MSQASNPNLKASYDHVSRIFLCPLTGYELTLITGAPDYTNSCLIVPIAMVHPGSPIRNSEQLRSLESFAFLLVYCFFISQSVYEFKPPDYSGASILQARPNRLR